MRFFVSFVSFARFLFTGRTISTRLTGGSLIDSTAQNR
jgi:hypothetical protein